MIEAIGISDHEWAKEALEEAVLMPQYRQAEKRCLEI